ncbi:hypothetical protein Bca101_013917 [Brassica carinata]
MRKAFGFFWQIQLNSNKNNLEVLTLHSLHRTSASTQLCAADQSKSNLGSSVDDEENLHPNQSSLEKQPLPWELRV